MRSDQIQRTWTDTLVSGLQEQYGITEQEARKKVDVWLECVGRGSLLYPQIDPAMPMRQVRQRVSAPAPISRIRRRASA